MDTKEDKRKGITMGKAILKLNAFVTNGMVTVHVLKARHLSSVCSTEPCQSYVEISLEPDVSTVSRCRTSSQPDRHPVFNEQFSLELMMPEDCKKRLYISVWNLYSCNQPNRDTSTNPYHPNMQLTVLKRTTQLEFMGCMSFGVHHILSEEKDIDGWYYLLRDGIGRRKHLQAILNSVIYSDAGDIRQMVAQSNSGDQARGNQDNQEQLYKHRRDAKETAYMPYDHVTQSCHQIIQDITSNTQVKSTPDINSTRNTQSDSMQQEEDTYTTFVFTKLPLRHENKNSHHSNAIQHNGDFNSKLHTQCPHIDEDESDYVKMYPPKSWQQSNSHFPSSPDKKPIKHVGFTDLVNSENVRGLPENRHNKERNIYSSEGLVDISEVDTSGYMSLSQVRREKEESIYASIEPINGSYINDNASEISEFTYSKAISKTSQALYPHLKNTPISSRKLLKMQQNITPQSRSYQDAIQQHTFNGNKQNVAQESVNKHKTDNFQKSATKPEINSVLMKHHTEMIGPKTEQIWSEYNNNIHNDSGIADHDSSPLSDCECSDNVHFAYKPNQDLHTFKSSLQSTPKAHRKEPQALKIDRSHTDTPIPQKRSLDNNNTRNIVNATTINAPKAHRNFVPKQQTQIEIHDVPRQFRNEKSHVVCTNDSCVEDNDINGISHTPSCPYHVCSNCNGIVPHYQSYGDNSCNHQSHTNNIPTVKYSQYEAPTRLSRVPESFYEDAYSDGMYSDAPYSEQGSSDDDFGYMSMEKFNIYKDTVLKHHRGTLQCQDHKTTTKIYFL